jgi:hypothetical protein
MSIAEPMVSTCPRCKRRFRTAQGLGLHFHHTNRAPRGRRERLCPDRRTSDEAREQDARLASVRVRLRDTEMLGRLVAHLWGFRSGGVQ